MDDLPRFFHPNAAVGSTLKLSEEESRHAKVLRLESGALVHCVDGKGHLFEAQLITHKRSADIDVSRLIKAEDKVDRTFTLAVAPTKNIARFEWVIEKATEIGVQKIIPIRCKQSERTRLNLDRLTKISVSAMKQSKGLWMPEISEIISFDDVMAESAEKKWIAHCVQGDKHSIHALSKQDGSQIIAIGPEGDFTDQEIALASAAGFSEISLGPKRLRTETAAIVACMAANLFHV